MIRCNPVGRQRSLRCAAPKQCAVIDYRAQARARSTPARAHAAYARQRPPLPCQLPERATAADSWRTARNAQRGQVRAHRARRLLRRSCPAQCFQSPRRPTRTTRAPRAAPCVSRDARAVRHAPLGRRPSTAAKARQLRQGLCRPALQRGARREDSASLHSQGAGSLAARRRSRMTRSGRLKTPHLVTDVALRGLRGQAARVVS